MLTNVTWILLSTRSHILFVTWISHTWTLSHLVIQSFLHYYPRADWWSSRMSSRAPERKQRNANCSKQNSLPNVARTIPDSPALRKYCCVLAAIFCRVRISPSLPLSTTWYQVFPAWLSSKWLKIVKELLEQLQNCDWRLQWSAGVLWQRSHTPNPIPTVLLPGERGSSTWMQI